MRAAYGFAICMRGFHARYLWRGAVNVTFASDVNERQEDKQAWIDRRTALIDVRTADA